MIQILPVIARCDHCNADVELASLQSFRCPRCGEPVSDLRQGRELDIDSIEIEDPAEEIEEIVNHDHTHRRTAAGNPQEE